MTDGPPSDDEPGDEPGIEQGDDGPGRRDRTQRELAEEDLAGGPAVDEHPAIGLDETVHQRVRLGILTMLSEAECAFTTLREELALTDGNLSRHLRILAEAGLIEVHKGYEGRRPSTWLTLTRAGRRALRDEVAALARLVARYGSSAG